MITGNLQCCSLHLEAAFLRIAKKLGTNSILGKIKGHTLFQGEVHVIPKLAKVHVIN